MGLGGRARVTVMGHGERGAWKMECNVDDGVDEWMMECNVRECQSNRSADSEQPEASGGAMRVNATAGIMSSSSMQKVGFRLFWS